MSDLVEFRHLKYIAAIAETANFTRAAERLFLAQPSLSKQIKDLEEGIGIHGVPGLRCTSGRERHWTRRAYGTRQEV